jgi:hypothetical protein
MEMKKMKFLAGILSGKELIKVKIKMNFFYTPAKKRQHSEPKTGTVRMSSFG